jgi:hypothetical protein
MISDASFIMVHPCSPRPRFLWSDRYHLESYILAFLDFESLVLIHVLIPSVLRTRICDWYRGRWLRPRIRIVVAANHVLGDLIFLLAYGWLGLKGRKGAKRICLTISAFYLFALLNATSSLVTLSVLHPFTKNTLFYVSLHDFAFYRFWQKADTSFHSNTIPLWNAL